ncbi:hypothetical protein [Paracidovorax cattleyae]|uniref:Uncharacterized protein n=1 Tax=Paracidovorax cattleyae TaxID=80868 RepID=A0A1H0N1F5_9BURK|nr:hypothetical protein [Paracidovorax cattleyae]AVS75644.1 hypothetical protein C8240_18105 [Paracidovorax cattleyae]SDO86355.1 hypothetical protein SAMN04489708_104153 [Paracidovorax cattleyae]
MIRVIDVKGRAHLINEAQIVRITEADTSSQWHGIRAFIKMQDGATIEVWDTVSEIAHSINQAEYAARYEWLRSRDLDAIHQGGIFAGKTPDNVVLNGADLDAAIDAERRRY